MAGAVYGLILAASVIEAADVARGDKPGELAVFVVATLVVFWVAHCYADVLGDWAENGRTPTGKCIGRAMRREWPMVAAPALPVLVLVVGALADLSPDGTIRVAIGVAVVELALTAFTAARRGGATVVEALIGTAFVGAFGVAIVLLKNVVH